ncbi:ABC transporter ATP-binding protein [Roseibium album]|uniref:Putative multidrug export ATP-binding/permease protein n=1 Tax=Roseibium album TaxID=311410 RepID=A0A0M6ZD51_9HYPH|nr:ABC transporter ATP-binding protein [Roseibium album]CTQ60100.1 Putative multidrug export ATP-binding/permease protein [Roseibium album]CTQ77359.1 Putative multidrug export ATP-binding/permease protein [Roseibium album]CTQ77585.1 Putative multidrug export ATP-binding/permease protein [Roseibium album]
MFDRFEKLVDPFERTELDVPPKGFWAFCWYYTKPVWPILLVVSVLGAIIAILEVMIFTFLGELVNWLSTESAETFFQDNWGQLLWMALVVLVVLPGITAIWETMFHQGLMGTYPMSVRWRVHRYLLRQSISFYQNDFAGRIANKLMQTALAVREVVTRIADILVYVTVYFFAALFVVAEASIYFVIPFVVWFGCYLVTMRVFVPRLKNVSREQADARSLMTGHVVDAYTNISTVKLFSHAEREEEYAKTSMMSFLKTVFLQMRLVTGMNITLTTLNMVLLFAVAGLSIGLWQAGRVGTGEIAVAVALVLRFQGMSQWILWEVSGLFENIGTVQDGINTISRERDVVDAPGAQPLSVPSGEIRFERIGFHYGKETGVIEELSLTMAPGEKIGLIGRSGAGKSTLVNLLLRFYDLERGRILIDGQDISNVRQDDIRANVGVVTQDTSLLHRSIFENVAYGKPNVEREEVESALEKAHALEFVRDLSDPSGRTGLEAHVGERGVKLSGGQRQRIAIARVLLKDAPILLLDEATSALDSEVELAIQESLFDLMKGKTVIAIAHRLSTIAAMDRLIVMDQGRIIEEGSHQELLEKNGLYAQLWQHQSGGFLAPVQAA